MTSGALLYIVTVNAIPCILGAHNIAAVVRVGPGQVRLSWDLGYPNPKHNPRALTSRWLMLTAILCASIIHTSCRLSH